jgi:hypothetical protein
MSGLHAALRIPESWSDPVSADLLCQTYAPPIHDVNLTALAFQDYLHGSGRSVAGISV